MFAVAKDLIGEVFGLADVLTVRRRSRLGRRLRHRDRDKVKGIRNGGHDASAQKKTIIRCEVLPRTLYHVTSQTEASKGW